MNTEEKAKRYDEALERAKTLYCADDVNCMDLETIFPELKESEDEKIRKTLLESFEYQIKESHPDKEWLCGVKLKEIVAWLEKQGEQESADKYEQKFHVGEWIVWQNKCYKVNDNGCGYELIEQNGLSTSLEYGTVDKSAHLWTIQDAKDGDVLVFKNNIGGIIICKSPSDYDTRSYCRLIRDNLINKEESGWDSTLLVPATKEQRDLLFSKMKEVGYEWNSEKKELKKLSQRMISAEVKEALYDKPTDEEMKELLRTEYEKGRADAIAEMKKDWSEDDERVIAIINNALTESNTPPDDYDKVYDWLESLRQRI